MRTLSMCLAAAMCLAGGCANYTKPVVPPQQKTQVEKNFDAVWQSSLETLQRYYFTVERQDRRAGIITTQPLTGRHWFEFWRPDAVTAYDVAEGSLQTIFRSAKVTIEPTAPGAITYKATVQVTVRRSDLPQAQITSTSEAFNLFVLPGGDATARNTYLMQESSDVDAPRALSKEWQVDLGRDDKLEAKILSEIEQKAYARIVAGR